MAKTIEGQGEYKVKNTGEVITYDYTFQAFNDLQDALDTIGEDEAFKLIQRMSKVDANNQAREKAKVANGHSSRKPMTEEAKAEAKAERKANQALLAKLKALTPQQREALGL